MKKVGPLFAILFVIVFFLAGCPGKSRADSPGKPSENEILAALQAHVSGGGANVKIRNFKMTNGWEENGAYIAEVEYDAYLNDRFYGKAETQFTMIKTEKGWSITATDLRKQAQKPDERK